MTSLIDGDYTTGLDYAPIRCGSSFDGVRVIIVVNNPDAFDIMAL